MDRTECPVRDVAAEARICIFSQRNLQRLVSRCADYRFEDVICEVDDVDLLAPGRGKSFEIGRRISNRLAQHLSVSSVSPGVEKVTLGKSYDLFFAKCLFPSDLLALNAVPGWRQRSKVAVCWLAEIWVNQLDKLKGHLKILSQFDYVLLNCSASSQPLQDAIGRPCSYVVPGIDAMLFCPYPNPPVRCVDVYSLGRRSEVTHKALLKMAESNSFFYVYDTIHRMDTFHSSQHRTLVASIAKRSRYFVANAAKIDRHFETQGQSEIGYRFLEGAAAGAVMLGEPPTNEAFAENFDWADAVIHMPFDTPDVGEILSDLDSQHERLEDIRRNNVANSLLRHDWAYRWRAILYMAGLEPRARLEAREKRLKELAEEVEETSSNIPTGVVQKVE
ncbi:MAG: glycosyltransferase family 1 protein [Phycisphaerales bacterium]|nr:MAG: glycosyltransferase family 1 protein [Phycisphaerales bacterium]